MATSTISLKKKIETLKKGLNNKFISASQKEKIKSQVEKLEKQVKASKPAKAPISSSLSRLQKLVNKKKYGAYKGAGVDLKKDAGIPAKPIGKRKAKSGNTYYEYRANRIDVKQPSKKAPYPKLAMGGAIRGGKFNVGDKVMINDSGYVTSFDGFDLSKPATITNKNKVKTSRGIVYTYNVQFEDGKKPFNQAIESMLTKVSKDGGYMAKGGELVDINNAKKSLIAKAKSKGIYENFGQKEVRQLEDKYGSTQEIRDFDNWAMNFDTSMMAKGGVTEKEVVESNAEMVLSQIKAVKHHAEELSRVVSTKSNIEAWVVGKIERASTDLSDITHYLEGNKDKMSMGGSVRYYSHKMDK
jgi:hypothetical protein